MGRWNCACVRVMALRLVVQAPQDDPLLVRIAVLPYAFTNVAVPEVIYDCVGDHAGVPDNDSLVVIHQAIFRGLPRQELRPRIAHVGQRARDGDAVLPVLCHVVIYLRDVPVLNQADRRTEHIS